MNNPIKAIAGFCLVAVFMLFSGSAFAQGTGNGNAGGNGNGATPTSGGVILPSNNNGQGFQNGQGHQNGNSNIYQQDCYAVIEQWVNSFDPGRICIIDYSATHAEYYIIRPRASIYGGGGEVDHRIWAFDEYDCGVGSAHTIIVTPYPASLDAQVLPYLNSGNACGALSILIPALGL